MSKFLAERGYRWYGTTRHQIPGHDLLPDTRRQPDIRPRVRLSQIDRSVHGHTSTSEVYHSSPWSSSLVAYRQMSRLTAPRCRWHARRSGMTAIRELRIRSRSLSPRGRPELHDQFRGPARRPLSLTVLGLGPLPNSRSGSVPFTCSLPPLRPGRRAAAPGARRAASTYRATARRSHQRLGAQVDLILRAVKPKRTVSSASPPSRSIST